MGKSVRIIRLLRALRLLRLVKLQSKFAELVQHIRSEVLETMAGLARMTCSMLMLAHYIACGWYAVGRYLEADMTWLLANEMDQNDVWYCYTTSLHWAVTQFTPAGMEVHPYNSVERIFTVLILLCSLVFFSSCLSGASQAITQLRNINAEQRKQNVLLRKYLRESRVSYDLGKRIWGFLQHNHYAYQKRVHEKDIVILNVCPALLVRDLRKEVFAPSIIRHPFFFQYSVSEPWMLADICMAITEITLSYQEELFARGDPGVAMYFISTGHMGYTTKRLYRNLGMQHERDVGGGDWACEAALWVKWQHLGWLLATTSCELFRMHGDKFRQTLEETALNAPQMYAEAFLTVATKHGAISDVWDDFDSVQEMAQHSFETETVRWHSATQFEHWRKGLGSRTRLNLIKKIARGSSG